MAEVNPFSDDILKCAKCGYLITLWVYNRFRYPNGACPRCGSKELKTLRRK